MGRLVELVCGECRRIFDCELAEAIEAEGDFMCPTCLLEHEKKTGGVSIKIHPSIYSEFELMAELLRKDGGEQSAEDLIEYVLMSIADGSRRPGAWERGMLEQMGILSEQPEQQEYRSNYGKGGE